MSIEKVSVHEKLSLFNDYWNPRIAGELNGQQVKLVKLSGDFVWHSHEHEDEMFYVLKGYLQMHLQDKILDLNEGEFVIIPKGALHKPVAAQEVHLMLFEPATTVNTGNNPDATLTRTALERV